MAKKIDFITKEIPAKGSQYVREVEVGEIWKNGDGSESLIAYSVIDNDEETVVICNINPFFEFENKITVDSLLTPVGSILKDVLGIQKNYKVQQLFGRHFITMKLASSQHFGTEKNSKRTGQKNGKEKTGEKSQGKES